MGTKTIAIAALAAFSALASADPSAADARFLRDAMRDNRIDVSLGRLAIRRGRTAAVRDFGARAIRDHGLADRDLDSAAKDAGVAIPDEARGKASAAYARLDGLRGARFDRAYRATIVASHRRDVATYEREIRTTHSPAIRTYARRALPILREHIRAIEAARI